jgi:hypothetical protein
MLGPRHDRALNNYARRFNTRVGGNQQFYQVDWVKANRNAHCRSCGYFHLRHLTPLWLSQHHHYIFGIQFPLASILRLLWTQFYWSQICFIGSPMGQWPVWVCPRFDCWWIEEITLWREQHKGRQVDQWDFISSLGASHTTKQRSRPVTFLSHTWVWSYITSWCDVKISTTGDVWRRRGWHCKTSRAWLGRGNLMQCIVAVGSLLIMSSSLPRQEHSTTLFQRWRYMILRWIQDDTGLHKLNSWWERSFIVHKVTGPGSYRLQYSDGQEVPNSWNIEHLCRFSPWSTGDIFYWCLEIDTTSTTPFYRFTTGITRRFIEGALLPYFQYLITSFRLVSWVSKGSLCLYFQYNSILPVYI